MVARVQNAGLARITSLLAAAAWWLQWGTGSAAAATSNVVTTTSTTEARGSATPSQTTGTVTNDTLTLTSTITAVGTRAITEVGAFDAAGSGSPPTGVDGIERIKAGWQRCCSYLQRRGPDNEGHRVQRHGGPVTHGLRVEGHRQDTIGIGELAHLYHRQPAVRTFTH